MGPSILHCLFFLLLGVLLCSGSSVTEKFPIGTAKRINELDHRDKSLISVSRSTTQLDVTTPITTVPVINPTTPTTTTPTPTTPTPVANPAATPSTPVITSPYTTPTTASPASSGGSWCIASQSASQTALQVALDYACGYGGADCSAIQPGASCYDPNTVRDHASYAFNDYYQKNPIPTSCNFGGTAVITNIDPSTPTCKYPSTSTHASVINTTNPTGSGSTVYGSEPSASLNSRASVLHSLQILFTSTCLLVSFLSVNHL
ncbi:PREDICTED: PLASMODESMATA CALLOSE-BINDING PROTEIN 2-like [Nelumbo nucifera]|uniref:PLASMODESMATA CALLOSE-BINDING PROTEIN 2-like n=2 Tax=Nelumbo nucifera TaxID=4432 RepID=A0A1U8B4N2_NELNU|nr:PREDICTED: PLASMODESMATA CALLOSE-BINDING PROTEIN 2-like [Nelumbo nucifera]XP_010275853.1 PREDICTED: PLASMODESMATA CALLOSE-BINDING PROTEIN 2-like [Nelumbo nucifera]XP_010275859.1 PREDICTED: PLASMODESMATA CALLOSE-BINDING PROTEIN 2-like [Nelumbo nucifera]DAD33800.1 TPA_asm: hypothetical protein HUJ06_012651 [Nelumbo nucifera]